MKRYQLTATDADLLSRYIGIRWTDIDTSEEAQQLCDLRFKNVLHQRSERIELRAWAASQWRATILKAGGNT